MEVDLMDRRSVWFPRPGLFAQSHDDSLMGAGKCEVTQLTRGAPACSWDPLLKPDICGRGEYFQLNAVTSDRVIDDAERLNVAGAEAETSASLALNALSTTVCFQVGKFPKIGVDAVWRPLPDQETPAMTNCESHEPAQCSFGPGRLDGVLLNSIFPKSAAELSARTSLAFRLTRSADRSAKLHERLIQIGAASLLGFRVLSGETHQGLSQRPEPALGPGFRGMGCDAENACQDASDVAVEDGGWLVEGNAANCARRVTSDAGERDDLAESSRKVSGVV